MVKVARVHENNPNKKLHLQLQLVKKETRIMLAARRLMINMETTYHNKKQDYIPDGIRGSRRAATEQLRTISL